MVEITFGAPNFKTTCHHLISHYWKSRCFDPITMMLMIGNLNLIFVTKDELTKRRLEFSSNTRMHILIWKYHGHTQTSIIIYLGLLPILCYPRCRSSKRSRSTTICWSFSLRSYRHSWEVGNHASIGLAVQIWHHRPRKAESP